MAKVKTARDLFYCVDDVMRLLGYSRSMRHPGWMTADARYRRLLPASSCPLP